MPSSSSDVTNKNPRSDPPSAPSSDGSSDQNSLTPPEENSGIRKIFAIEDDLRVVAQAENYVGLLAALERFPSDIVLLDGAMIAGIAEAIPDMMRRAPNSKLIVQVS